MTSIAVAILSIRLSWNSRYSIHFGTMGPWQEKRKFYEINNQKLSEIKNQKVCDIKNPQMWLVERSKKWTTYNIAAALAFRNLHLGVWERLGEKSSVSTNVFVLVYNVQIIKVPTTQPWWGTLVSRTCLINLNIGSYCKHMWNPHCHD
jgi:hypothetical protein